MISLRKVNYNKLPSFKGNTAHSSRVWIPNRIFGIQIPTSVSVCVGIWKYRILVRYSVYRPTTRYHC